MPRQTLRQQLAAATKEIERLQEQLVDSESSSQEVADRAAGKMLEAQQETNNWIWFAEHVLQAVEVPVSCSSKSPIEAKEAFREGLRNMCADKEQKVAELNSQVTLLREIVVEGLTTY